MAGTVWRVLFAVFVALRHQVDEEGAGMKAKNAHEFHAIARSLPDNSSAVPLHATATVAFPI